MSARHATFEDLLDSPRDRDESVNETEPLLGHTSTSYDATLPDRGAKNIHLVRKQPNKYAVCCTFFSILGILFLSWIGLYASMGWNYQQKGWSKEQLPTVQQNAFTGAMMYLGTLIISVFYWIKTSKAVLD